MKKKLDFKVLAIMGVVVFSACDSDSDLFNPEKAAAKLFLLSLCIRHISRSACL